MKIVQGNQKHFTRDLAELAPGANSDRTITPEADGVRVKTTRFRCPAKATVDGISYDCDESVIVESGAIQFSISDKFNEANSVTLRPGDHYHTPAGEVYSVRALEDTVVWCVFSPASDAVPVNSN